MIRASAPYTSGWGSFVLLKKDHVRVVWGSSLSTLHRCDGSYDICFPVTWYFYCDIDNLA